MNAKVVVRKGKQETNMYKCDNCHNLFLDKQIAENCCKTAYCLNCGKELTTHAAKLSDAYYIHPMLCCDCKQKLKGSKYITWTEQQYLDINKQYHNKYESVVIYDTFYCDLYDAIQSLWDEGYSKDDIRTMQFFVTESTPIPKINIDNELERIYETTGLEDVDIESIFDDLQELYDFIEKWNEKQTYTYWEQQSIIVIPTEETLDEYCNY